MELQIQPNRWSCSVAAWAMAMDLPIDYLLEEIGHDGSELISERVPEPQGRAGFHTQELVEVALLYGEHPVPWQLFPTTEVKEVIHHLWGVHGDNAERWKNFVKYIKVTKGVISGMGKTCTHVVAYEKGTIYDPSGTVYEYSREEAEANTFFGNQLWIF